MSLIPDIRRTSTAGRDTAEDAQFRAAARHWLTAHAPRRQGDQPWPAPSMAEVLQHAREMQRQLFDAGLAGLSIPAAYGGAGREARAQQIWAEEVAGYDLSVGALLVGVGMCAPTIALLGTEDQRRTLLPPLLSADVVWCQLFSEPGAGSDLGAVSTRARVGPNGDWVINGQKVWTSAAQFADYGMLIARTGATEEKHRGLTMFVLDLATAGITVQPLQQITGEAEFNEVFFDDVHIPADAVLGTVGGGWAAVLTMLASERSALTTGIGMVDIDVDTPADLAIRTGRADDAVVREGLARLVIEATILRILEVRAGEDNRVETAPGADGACSKLRLSLVLRQRADLLMAIAGPLGVAWRLGDPDAGRWAQEYLGAPALSIGGGTDQIQRNVIAERLLGLPRERPA